jgi:hypothetical protein
MKRLAVLDKGWVQLEESMGDDAVIRGARVCFDSYPDELARTFLDQAGIELVVWNHE